MGIDRRTRRAVFLDRDGVINAAVVRDGKPYPPDTLDDLQVLSDVREALARLHDAGFRLVIVTNQPDVARGWQHRSVVDAMHARLASKPGMLEAAARDADLSLAACYMVGDRWRDIEAGQRAGCRTIFIDRQYHERQPENPDAIVQSLSEAADWILSGGGNARS
jgi:D-glycero-D-manno-heptose 1,7-bisphosphate phosphatase